MKKIENDVPKEKKELTFREGLEAACILFALNTEKKGVLHLIINAGFPDTFFSGEENIKFTHEWCAFIHAAVATALMQTAPNSILVAYLRQTKNLLQIQCSMDETKSEQFIDGPFAAYMAAMAQEAPKECPTLFFKRLCGKELKEMPQKCVQLIAQTMAMAMAEILDRLEHYSIASE